MFDESVHNILKRKNKIFALSVSFFALAFTVARMVLTRFYTDPYVHYYYTDKANILVKFFDYIVGACIIAIYIASAFLYSRKKEKFKYIETVDCFVQGTQAQVFSASLTGFLFAFGAVFQAYNFIASGGPGEAWQKIRTAPFFTESIRQFMDSKFFACLKLLFSFDCLIFFFSILSAVYFFKTAALNFDVGKNIGNKPEPSDGNAGKKYSSAHIIFSFMPIVWSFLNIFKCFFDMSKSVNSPVRIYELVSFLAISAYFVSESRMIVGRRETSRFFTYAYVSVIIAAMSSLPNLIWSSFWILSTNNDQIVYAVQIAVVIYIYSRIYSQVKYGRFSYQR